MNKIISIFILSILTSCLRHKEIIDKWDNGNKKVVLTYDNYKNNKTFKKEYFYENGNLEFSGNYIEGKQDGVWEWWYENGNKKDEALLKSGFYIEKRRHWRENGKLEKVEIISNECLGECCDGQVIDYYENGQIESESNILNGVRTGKYIYRYDNGQPKKMEYFKNGLKEGKYYEWFKDGKKWVEGIYKNDKQDSVWTWFDEEEKIVSIQLFKEGKFIKIIKEEK